MSLSLWQATARAQMRSLGNGIRGDSRFRVGALIGLLVMVLFFLAGSFWSVRRLLRLQMEGSDAVTSTLWLGMAGVWVGVTGLTIIGALRQGFGTDSARLALTLPLPPANRFRLFVYRTLSEEGGGNLLAVSLAFGFVLQRVLGWGGLLWLLPFWAGSLVAVWLVCLLLVIFIRYFLPRLRRLVVPLLLMGTGLEAVALIFGGEVESVALPALTFPVLPATGLLLLLAVLGLGPLAGWGGRCYVAAWQVLESRGTGRKARLLPGVGLLAGWLARRRSLIAALLVRSLINQTRHPLVLPRLVVLPVYGLIFPLLHSRLVAGGFSEGQSIATFAGVMGGLLLLEYGIAYPISAEGARLALFLTAPAAEKKIWPRPRGWCCCLYC